MAEITIHGRCDDGFALVRDAFARNFADGGELGASVAVTVEGEMVVDLWAGWADEARTRPWQRDTIVNVYSTTKTMAALTALLLADRGALDLDAPVARYWPEFAAHGKGDVKVSHVLSHSAGLSGWEAPVTPEDCCDWEKMTSLLAAQAPWWKPGTAPGYHALSQGYLIGEVVRRATGRTIGAVFREEIAGPLDADFHIGLAPAHDARVADLVPTPGGLDGAISDPASIAARTLGNPRLTALEPRTRAWRGAEIPAAGGTGNARSVAEVQTLVANRGVSKGKRLLSEAGVRRALEPQVSGTDLVLGFPVTFGIGFGLGSEILPLPNANTCFWGGWGGSLVINDLDARMCVAYAMNRMVGTTTGDARGLQLAAAAFQASQA
jgi:CubicO group peptidase (beta-lactamase class C family)